MISLVLTLLRASGGVRAFSHGVILGLRLYSGVDPALIVYVNE